MPSLAGLTWPEAAAFAEAGAILAVPVGSTEQHGPHLPLSTDADIALALALGLGARRSDVVVAPPVAYGSSGEHADFAGTLSIGQEAVELLLVELGRSATIHFRHLLFVSTHGGNDAPVRRAERRLRTESRDVLAWTPRFGGDPHAGREETSLQLLLHEPLVREELAEAGDRRPLAEIMPVLYERGVRAVSPNGVLGDPAGASRPEGEMLFERLLDELGAAVAAWCPYDPSWAAAPVDAARRGSARRRPR